MLSSWPAEAGQPGDWLRVVEDEQEDAQAGAAPSNEDPLLHLAQPGATAGPLELTVRLPAGRTWTSVRVVSSARTLELYAGRLDSRVEYVGSGRGVPVESGSQQPQQQQLLAACVSAGAGSSAPGALLRLRLLSLRPAGACSLRSVVVVAPLGEDEAADANANANANNAASQPERLLAALAAVRSGALDVGGAASLGARLGRLEGGCVAAAQQMKPPPPPGPAGRAPPQQQPAPPAAAAAADPLAALGDRLAALEGTMRAEMNELRRRVGALEAAAGGGGGGGGGESADGSRRAAEAPEEAAGGDEAAAA